MTTQKIIPCIWITAQGGEIASVIQYYKTAFGNQFQAGAITPLGDTPSGHAEMSEVEIFGTKYLLMVTEQVHHPLNDSVSLMITCEDQNEIDHYWDYFTRDGKASQCGWCMDQYGLRWQVIPKNMKELMRLPNFFKVMMEQKKIVISEYYT